MKRSQCVELRRLASRYFFSIYARYLSGPWKSECFMSVATKQTNYHLQRSFSEFKSWGILQTINIKSDLCPYGQTGPICQALFTLPVHKCLYQSIWNVRFPILEQNLILYHSINGMLFIQKAMFLQLQSSQPNIFLGIGHLCKGYIQ